MKCTAVLIDARPGFMRLALTPPSLLTLPFGAGCVLDHVGPSLRDVVHDSLYVYPRFAPSKAYLAALRETDGKTEHRVITNMETLLSAAEPTDWFLLLDVSESLLPPMDRAGVELHSRDPRCVTNFIANRNHLSVREEVFTNGGGQVRRIQRYYDGVTELQHTRHVATLISAAVLRQVRDVDLRNLTGLRAKLARRVIPQNDILYRPAHPAPDSAAGFLRNVRSHLESGVCGQADRECRIQLGEGTAIDETARLHGIVIVQDGARIGRGAYIVGPALIARGARVGGGAVITHGLIGPMAVVPPEARLHRCLFLAGMEPATKETTRGSNCVVDEPDEGVSQDAGWVVTTNHPRRPYLYVKRAVDLAAAAAGLVVLSPLLLVAAALVKLTSSGPVLYGDRREGKGGREFRCWKFRTMVTDAAAKQRALYSGNELDGPQFKMENDERITALGQWLRKTNIDELPQLFNVLLGEMSLVGPRPSPFRENQICVPWRQARLAVRPGITGLWQLCRRDRELGDFHQWIWYDLLYVRYLSAGIDAKILAATLLTLGGRWPVPLQWFLSHRLREKQAWAAAGLPRRIPILEQSSSAGCIELSSAVHPSAFSQSDQQRQALLEELRAIALSALPRMFMPQQREFVHSLRRRRGNLVPVGRSLRYTAMVLIGLRAMPDQVATQVLRGVDPDEVLDHLIGTLPRVTNLGDAAVIYWAACRWQHPRRDMARERMAALLDFGSRLRTVEVAWCLSACCDEPRSTARCGALRYRLADLLMNTFNTAGNVFTYRTGKARGIRGHLACFADQVYPIMALSLYHRTTPSPAALDVARRTADTICQRQGPAGQWWWHYDTRNGQVIEKYPVYAVHQDAMAPMALYALEDAGGPSYQAEVDRGLDWLRSAEELAGGTLVDPTAGVIWRKVARHEPRKLARTVQSLASRARAGWRVPGLDFALPPGSIDYECRPYHLGWFFEAFARQLSDATRSRKVKIA